MDMTSREAASALGISVESYYKACYRLRKKMQIDAVDGLVDFVKNVETGQALPPSVSRVPSAVAACRRRRHCERWFIRSFVG